MGLAEYGFALFIFCLACLFALLCKYLFGRTKTHLQALDEKEKKLLAFYSTLEDMMDEFNDSAVRANAELAQNIASLRNVAASLRSTNMAAQTPAPAPAPPAQALAQTQAQNAAAVQAAAAQAMATQAVAPAAAIGASAPISALSNSAAAAAIRPRNTAPSRQNMVSPSFDPPIFEVVSDITPVAQAATPAPEQVRTGPDRPARILMLHRNGMDRLHIAKELSVTLSEVDLVLGIAGQR